MFTAVISLFECELNDMSTFKTDNHNEHLFVILAVCHAEMNAILNKYAADVRDSRMYVSLFPCNECTKIIIQAGLAEVIYYSDKKADKPETKASKEMLKLAGVRVR